MKDFPAEFGAHLRAIRLGLQFSQEEVAHRAGLHVTYLSGIERGHRNPSLKNIRLLAMALGVPMTDLFAGLDG